jgi:hypothetical protein
MGGTLRAGGEMFWFLAAFDRYDIDVLTSVSRFCTRRVFCGVEDVRFAYVKILSPSKGLYWGVLGEPS